MTYNERQQVRALMRQVRVLKATCDICGAECDKLLHSWETWQAQYGALENRLGELKQAAQDILEGYQDV